MMSRNLAPLLALAAAVCAAPRAARADPAAPAAYAVVVGSNPGGPGQAELRFAEDDARRVADLLHELGGYDRGDIHLVLRPTPALLRAAIAEVSVEVGADAAAGRQSMVFFYYSGHARAAALNLGEEELPLAELRDRLLAVPATLTVVVLDACQSGAFSRIKGAEPAADFSFNSLAKLSASGIAVLASSSGSELSQESDRLGASYFTHNLLVGLRGGGDANGDGRVSLDEAYHYAYHQTLVATAATAVGAQHVSLEVDLRGKGDVALTYPDKADARLMLPGPLAGDVVVQRLPAQAVLAELHKSKGAAVELALPAGDYRVLVRIGGEVRGCDVDVRGDAVTPLRIEVCEVVPQVDELAKGGEAAPAGPPWGLEVIAGAGVGIDDDYTQRLRDFGYEEGFLDVSTQLGAGLSHRITSDLEAVGEIGWLGGQSYSRSTDLQPLRISWGTATVGAHIRAIRELAGGAVIPFAQLGGGVARARTRFTDEADRVTYEGFWGLHLDAAAGLEILPWRPLGFVARATYVYAPVIKNLLDDTHDGGGLFFAVGVVSRF